MRARKSQSGITAEPVVRVALPVVKCSSSPLPLPARRVLRIVAVVIKLQQFLGQRFTKKLAAKWWSVHRHRHPTRVTPRSMDRFGDIVVN